MSTTFDDAVIINNTAKVTSTSATAFAVAASGTAYGLQVDQSAASAATGLKVTAAAAGSGLALATVSSGSNESLTIDAKGSGSVTVAGTSTGNVVVATGGGNVGIGTASPGRKLVVSGSGSFGAAGAARIDVANTVAGIGFAQHVDDAGVWQIADTNGLTKVTLNPGNNGAIKLFTGTGSVIFNGSGGVGINTATPGSLLHVNGGIQVGTAPTGGDKGNGTINVSGDIYKNGTAYTNPDYVFEQHFAGTNDSGYPGLVPLERLESRLREERRLPGIDGEPMGVFARQDLLLEKLEEAYLYIVELTRRVQELEAARRLTA